MTCSSIKKIVGLIFFLCCFITLKLQAQQQVNEHFIATPLEEVFQIFADKYNLLLAFDPAVLENQTISLQLKEEPVVSAFYQILDQSSLAYITLSEGQILIRPADSAPPPPLSYHKISGRISDANTGEYLAYTTVYCPQLGRGTSTDQQGRYQLHYPDTIKEQLVLEARYLGYTPQQQQVQGNQADFKLAAAATSIGTIIVTDQAPSISLSSEEQALVIRPDNALPNLGGTPDLLRNLQLLPGVTAFNDRSATLQVRGGTTDENLILWDGMLLYAVDHFFGAFGAVNSQLVHSVKLYKNTFPISYGGRTSSILMIQSHPLEEASYTEIEVGSLVANASSKIPLAKGMAMQIGLRSSINNLAKSDLFRVLDQEIDRGSGTLQDLLEESRQVRVQPAFRFYDANFKWQWQVGEHTYFDVNAYRSEDHYDYDYSLDFRTRLQGRILENTALFQEKSEWKNTAYSLRWQQSWHPNWKSDFTVGYSTFKMEEATNIQLTRERPDQNTLINNNQNTRNNELYGVRFNWNHQFKLTDHSQLAIGIRGNSEQVDLQITADTLNLLVNDGTANQIAFYTAHEWRKEKWFFQTGLHTTYYTGTKKFYPSLRIQATYQANEQWQLKGSANHYYQFLRRYYHENRFGRSFQIWTLADGAAFPVGSSNSTMLGFTFRKGSFLLDAEAYYKKSKGVLEHTTIINQFNEEEGVANGNAFYQIAQGTGKVVGLDLLVRKEWNNYATWLAYTLSRSTRQFDDFFQGLAYAAQDDRPHQLQWVNEYQHQKWTFSGVYIFASGRPYLDLAVENLVNNRGERNANSLRRIPAYHRVDFSVRYEHNVKDKFFYGSIGVLNIFDHANTLYSQRIYALPQENNRNILLGNELQLLGRTFSVAAGFKF